MNHGCILYFFIASFSDLIVSSDAYTVEGDSARGGANAFMAFPTLTALLGLCNTHRVAGVIGRGISVSIALLNRRPKVENLGMILLT